MAVATHHPHLDTRLSFPSYSGGKAQWAAIKVGLSVVCGNTMPRRPVWYGINIVNVLF